MFNFSFYMKCMIICQVWNYACWLNQVTALDWVSHHGRPVIGAKKGLKALSSHSMGLLWRVRVPLWQYPMNKRGERYFYLSCLTERIRVICLLSCDDMHIRIICFMTWFLMHMLDLICIVLNWLSYEFFIISTIDMSIQLRMCMRPSKPS